MGDMRHTILLGSLLSLGFSLPVALAQGAPPIQPAGVAAAAAAPPPAKQELMYQGEATSILGRQVHDPAGDVVGRIVDVLVDDSGQPRAAVIDFGGFMGIGNRTIAVAWRALHFAAAAGASGRGAISLDMTQDQIKATPDFHRPATPADPPVTVAVPPPVQPGPPLPATPQGTPPT